MIGIGFLCHAKHDNVNMMARAMADGFRANGVDFHLVDTREADAGKQLLTRLQAPDDLFLCTFNNIGLPAEPDSPLIALLNARKAPVFSWYLDHPYVNAPDFALPISHHLIGETALDHLNFLETYPVHQGKSLHLMPHAVAEGSDFHWDDKDIPVLMIGTVGGDPETARCQWQIQYGNDVAATLNAAIEVYDSADQPTLITCIHEALALTPQDRLDWTIMRSYCILLDRYLRDRMKYAQARLAIGCGGMVLGPGWADKLPNARPEQVPGEVAADKLEGYITRARAVFAGSPAYYASHERCFLAASQSAIPIVTRNPAMAAWLDDGVIDLDDRQSDLTAPLREQINDIVSLGTKAEAAHHACRTRHLYRQRCGDILAAITSAATV